MAVTVEFQCGGCHEKEPGKNFGIIKQPLEQVSPNFARRLPWNVDEVTPDGWIASDPYTGACYCPSCWWEIENR